MTIDINSVGIIGAGPSGLASLYELLHTTKDGKSTIKNGNTGPSKFDKIVVYEQNANVGGVWATDLSEDQQIPQSIFDSQNYNDPHVIKKENKNIPTDEELDLSSFESPISKSPDSDYIQWNKSPVYPGLYTNIPKKFMRFSYIDYEANEPRDDLDPLFTYDELFHVFDDFANKNDLKKFIRFNTEVIKLTKDQKDDKWSIISRSTNPETGQDLWYQEKFDAVIIAAGHYYVPYIPYFKGLNEYIKKNKKDINILHAKYFRDANDFKDRNVLVVGASISGIDITQYVYPLSKNFYLSRNIDHPARLEWINEASASVQNVSLIEEFVPDTKEIKLKDGTTLTNIDAIIFSTGYHVEVPFYNDFTYSIPEGLDKPTGRSRIKHLYQNIFNVDDPTLAIVGSLYSPYLIKAIESAASAIAGVWSGAKQLPSKEAQLQWERERVETAGDNNFFHLYTPDQVGSDFVGQIKEFFPLDRPNPLEDDVENKELFLKGLAACKRVFFAFRNGDFSLNHVFT